MMRLDLTSQEAGELEHLLEEDLSDLRFEIMDTDNLDYRNRLKLEEWLIKNLLARLPTDYGRVSPGFIENGHASIRNDRQEIHRGNPRS